MGQIKQTNFRIDSEQADLFRQFCEDQGMNQAQGFDHLMEVLALNEAKMKVPERQLEIEEFERHTKAILNAFLTSVALTHDTEKRVYENFRTQLESKESLILDLQNKIAEKENAALQAASLAADAEKKVKASEESVLDAVRKVNAAESRAQDKEEINSMLNAEITKLKNQLEGYDALKASEIALQGRLASAEQNIKDLKKDAEIAKERTVFEITSKKEAELRELEREKNKEIEKLQEKILALHEEKSDLKDTIMGLRTTVANLKSKEAASEAVK